MTVEVISKANGAVTQVAGTTIDLDAPSIVRLDLSRTKVAGFERQGHDLVVRLANGETIRIVDFYPEGAALPNDLVLREGDGRLWLARGEGGSPHFSLIKDLEDLSHGAGGGGGSSLTIPALLGGLAAAAAGVVALAGGGDTDQRASGGGTPAPDTGTGGTAPDREAPLAPSATVRADGAAVTGRGEAGATVTVRNASGAAVGTAVVATDGSYTSPVSPALVNGERLTVTQADAAGNVSPAVTAQAPDLTAPTAPTATVDASGATVTGRGEAGATVTIRDSAGAVVGTAIVGADGSYTVRLDTPRIGGETLSIAQADAAGNVSPTVTASAPDLTAPTAPTAAVDASGATVTGRGEAGATVTVRDANGAAVGTAVVAADGSYTASVSPALVNGERLTVTQADAAGNVSPAVTAQAPDLTAPTAPTATVDAAGATVTGRGEAGATVTIRDGAGAVAGTAVVAVDGGYTVRLDTPRVGGETLSITQADAAGNVSPTVTASAPDLTAPAAPTATVNADGTVVSGTGEAGGRVTVTDGAGTVVGTAPVGADGGYSVTLTPPQANGGTLTVSQSDPAGNVSPGTGVPAPDLTAPAQPTATINGDGTTVSGQGEPGARITVADAAGGVIGTATVAANGSYAVALTPAQANGQALTVVQADAAGNSAPPLPLTAPDITAPAAPLATLDATGTIVTGTGEAGARVSVRGTGGVEIGSAIVGAQGGYVVTLSPAQVDRQTLAVVQTDAAGNASAATPLTAPDLTAPAAPGAIVTADGGSIGGSGEPGAIVTVRSPLGAIIATTTVAADGSYAVPLSPPVIDGEVLTVHQADAAGNVSPVTNATAPDLIVGDSPDAPTAAISADGALVTGVAAGGAAVTLYDAGGVVIATGVAAADGSYSIALTPPRIDSETIRVTQTDADGDVSPPATVVAPDLTAPAAPVAVLDASGSVVTGSAEAGATVVVRAADGTILGSATANARGDYAVGLTPAQVDGGTIAVTQADAAGNVSPPTSLFPLDTIAPAAPVATVSGDGLTVTGTGEAGATVTVRDAGGSPIGSATVAADGSFAVPLTPAQANGETVAVTQADASGNVSPATVAVAPDITGPALPGATIAADGGSVSGTGEPGATVTVATPAGTVIGSAVVQADGSYSAVLTPAQADGQTVTVVQTDAAGNASPTLALIAPDITAPAAPVAMLDATGSVVMGSGEVGATVTVRDAAGGTLGSVRVDAQGGYTVVLTTPQTNVQALTVVQADGAGNVSPATPLTAPDLTAPAAPVAVVAADGLSIAGSGEAGATVTIRGPLGAVIGSAVVTADGSYSAALTPAQTDGEVLRVTQADAAGNVSPPTTVSAPDLVIDTDPDAPTAAVGADGASVAGVALGGAAITVYDAAGNVIGTGTADVDGRYSIALSPPRIDGETVRVTQTEADGDISPPAVAIAPDLTAPAAPTATLDGRGGVVTGTGEPGATIAVRNAAGTVLGSATVTAGGAYAAALVPAQTNGEALTVTQADRAGNVSPPVPLVAPDFTAPAAPVASVAADGASVTGTGEPGATVTVRDAAGTPIGTATVAADGGFVVPLTPAQANGGTVGVVQADAAGNASPVATIAAPDITAPAAPTIAIGGDGIAVTGTGEPGATVTLTGVGGVVLGSAVVGADGRYAVSLTPAQINGETVTATQADPTGNVSPSGSAVAPDLVAPAAPTAIVSPDGLTVSGLGEAGARIAIVGPGGGVIGTATVAADRTYTATLDTPQLNGERLVATQTDGGNNVSPPATAFAPDVTAPGAPTALAVAADGGTLTGAGEAGARVEVRSGAVLIGTATVAADGSFAVPLAPAQLTGATLTVTQADVAGNVSIGANTVAPFDIDAFDNVASVSVDLIAAATPVNFGTASYLALVSLGLVNVQAQVLAIPSVQFTVQAGHSLDAIFTYDAAADVGVASDYAVVVQRLVGGQWVAVEGTGGTSLLDVGLLAGNLTASDTFEPGQYRAFLTFQGTVGLGLLGSLNVTGTDTDFTDVAGVTPGVATGNVIIDPSPAGEVDIVGPGTRVASVTVNGVVTVVNGAGTVVDGAWGTLTINPDGSYSYTPDALATTIGQTDVFTYTLLDPTDGERESATLSITIGSGDITGLPVAVADTAVVAVTYDNVVTVQPPAQAFTFQTGGLGAPGRGDGAFTVAARTEADVTITAVRSPGLSVLPSYTLTVRDDSGTPIRTQTSVAVAGLPIGGTGVSFAVNDLPAGHYTYSLSSSTLLGTFGTTVSLGTSTTLFDEYRLATRGTAEGNLLANDTANTPFVAIRVDAGGGFAEVGETPVVLNGQHGTLTVYEAGGYVYQPSASLGYSPVDLVDTFTYQVAQPNGTFATATLAVTIDVPADGVAAAPVAFAQLFSVEADVIPLDALIVHQAAPATHADAPATGLATYDLFEGQGAVEDVLSHYLGAQQVDHGPVPTSDAGPAIATVDITPTPIADPLDYLVVIDDQDRIGTSATHVV